MNYNNRLSSTLANNIRLDSSKEYEAEKIAGGNIIWLVNRPAGVKIYVNSTPDRSGALVLNEANRGYKWEQLGNYGDLKLYDNFYLWTEGKNINGDLIELQVSPNADIITPILGNTADKIDKISEIENLGNNVLYGLYRVNKELFSTRKLVYMDFVNASYEILSISSRRYLFYTNIADFSNINFNDEKIYMLALQGHCDISSNAVNEESQGAKSWTSQSLHFNLIDMSTVSPADYTEQTNIDKTQISNLFLNNDTRNPFIETKDNHFTVLGGKQTVDRYATPGNTGAEATPMAWGSLPQSNFDIKVYAPAFFFNKMKGFIACYKAGLNLSHNYGNYGFHFSVKIQIEEMESLPGDPIIDAKPYINPAFKK